MKFWIMEFMVVDVFFGSVALSNVPTINPALGISTLFCMGIAFYSPALIPYSFESFSVRSVRGER